MAAERGKWFRSSYSDAEGDQCVECMFAGEYEVSVRDRKDVRGPVIRVSSSAWVSFLHLLPTL